MCLCDVVKESRHEREIRETNEREEREERERAARRLEEAERQRAEAESQANAAREREAEANARSKTVAPREATRHCRARPHHLFRGRAVLRRFSCLTAEFKTGEDSQRRSRIWLNGKGTPHSRLTTTGATWLFCVSSRVP